MSDFREAGVQMTRDTERQTTERERLPAPARQDAQDLEAQAAGAALDAQAKALMCAAADLPSAKKRLDLLLDAANADEIVPRLPAEQLFFTIQGVGLSDALELVHLSSPEQFMNFIDLGAWERDELSVPKVITWLRAAGTDADEARFEKKLAALDVEVLERLLQAGLRIWDLEETPDPEPQGEVFRSPEGKYLLEFLVEGVELAGLKRVVNLLFAQDPLQAARLIEAVRWELSAELTESAYRWRSARLSDLGFPDLEEALSYFAFVDPNAALPASPLPQSLAPIFSLSPDACAHRFFERALGLIPGTVRPAIEGQIIALLNAVLVVEGIDPGVPEDVEQALTRARDTLSLGLERAASGDPERGAHLLATVPLKRLFQIGVSLALKLKFRLDRLARRAQLIMPGAREPLLDAPHGQLFAALRHKRPLFIDWPEGEAGAMDAPTVPTRAFRDLADIARAEQWIAEIEQMVDLMCALGLNLKFLQRQLIEADLEEEGMFLRYSTLYLTAIAREVSGAGFAFAPLPRSRLADFGRAAFERRPDGQVALQPGFVELLAGKLRRRAVDFSPAHVETAARFAERLAQRLMAELAEPWSLGTLEGLPNLPLLLMR